MQRTIEPELLNALAEVVENPEPNPALVEDLGLEWSKDAFTELFDFDLPPYASYYLTIGPVLGGEPVSYLRGLLSSYLPLTQQPAQPDSLAYLLRLLALVIAQHAWDRADAIFFESLYPWLSTYAHAVQAWAPLGLRPVGELLGALVTTWVSEMPIPAVLPYLLREAPQPSEGTGAEELLDYFMSPVASAMMLPRSVLISIARRDHLGIRPGGRRFSFQSLLETSPEQTFNALLALVEYQLCWYAESSDLVATWWRNQLGATRSHLVQLINELSPT